MAVEAEVGRRFVSCAGKNVIEREEAVHLEGCTGSMKMEHRSGTSLTCQKMARVEVVGPYKIPSVTPMGAEVRVTFASPPAMPVARTAGEGLAQVIWQTCLMEKGWYSRVTRT